MRPRTRHVRWRESCEPLCILSSRLSNLCHNGHVTEKTSPDKSPETDSKHQNRRKLSIDQGWAIVIAAVITAVGVTAGSVVTIELTNRTFSPVSTTGSAATHPTLTFTLTAHSRVPWCENYSGTGTIPSGSALLIFSTPADPNGNPASPHYSYNGKATQISAGHWLTEPLQIGLKGQANYSVDIVGVLTAEGVYNYLNSIITRDPDWVSTTLPPGWLTSLPVVTTGRRGMACY
jgi:hypothetical protein